jgi:uncharacterized UPF0160 family protein
MLKPDYARFLEARHQAHVAFVHDYLSPILNSGRPITIGTHNEKFHADEVVAIVLLTLLIDRLGGTYEIHRLERSSADNDRMDILVDTGRVYDPLRGRFDHHQPDGAGCRIDRSGRPDVPFSSCGLVWFACGLVLTGEVDSRTDTPAFDTFDWGVIRGVDASDNGYITSRSRTERPPALDADKVFYGPMAHLSKLIGQANGRNIHDHAEQMRRFLKEIEVRRYEMSKSLEDATLFAQDRKMVRAAVDAQRHGDCRDILFLDEYVRWSDHLPGMHTASHVRIVITKVAESGAMWNVQIVNRRSQYATALPPTSWRGLEGAALEAASGIAGLTFCHAHGQIIRANSRDAALQAALFLLTQPT